ncbi:hypothetical protein [Clostridium sp.]|uniref:hypothetical protein n=1 Tax=Clostridium sp. TaxID=1506 RepID=UPI003D6CD636
MKAVIDSVPGILYLYDDRGNLIQWNKKLIASYTKMKEMQSYLIQSEKMSALGNLVAGITHEINTPK